MDTADRLQKLAARIKTARGRYILSDYYMPGAGSYLQRLMIDFSDTLTRAFDMRSQGDREMRTSHTFAKCSETWEKGHPHATARLTADYYTLQLQTSIEAKSPLLIQWTVKTATGLTLNGTQDLSDDPSTENVGRQIWQKVYGKIQGDYVRWFG